MIDGLTKDIARDPSESAHFEDRGDCYRQVGNFSSAAQDYRRLAELEQRRVDRGRIDSLRLTRLGIALYRMGDLEAALRAFESMKDLPGESISYDHVTDQAFFQAMAFWRLGDKETARSRYAVAVARLNENDADNNSHRYFVRVHAEAADLLGVTANGLSPAHGARPAIFPPPD